MENKLPPWSFSMLEKFENCPRSAFHKYILKEKEATTPAIEEGNRVHKALELRVRDGTPLPNDLIKYEPLASSIQGFALNYQTPIHTELKLGITRAMAPCGFFDGNVWGRCAADVTVMKGEFAWVGDWKTGKPREKELQVKICAMFLFKKFPEISRVVGTNIWLKESKVGTAYSFTRDKEAEYWKDIITRVQKMENALEKEYWPEQPSGLCGWCPVKSCKYNKG